MTPTDALFTILNEGLKHVAFSTSALIVDVGHCKKKKKNVVCVIMRKRESLGGGNGCIALQVRRRFPLVLNILFTRMQCDTSFGDVFQDKDKLSANKQRSCDAPITSYIVLYAHTSCCLGSLRCFLLCCHCTGTFQT